VRARKLHRLESIARPTGLQVPGRQEGRPRDEGGLLASRLFAVGSLPFAVIPWRLEALSPDP